MELDGFDRRLLDALQQNSRRTGEELAEIAGLSPAACLRRVQRLREDGVIEREVALLAPEAAGRKLTVIALVSATHDHTSRLETADRFRRLMQAAPEVSQCYYVTGSADFVVIVNVADMEAYEKFTKRFFFETYIKGFESIVVMNRVKFETAVPITDV